MEHLPFLLTPAAKNYLWGGRRLNDEYGLGLPVFPLAEAWMCSVHKAGQSTLYDNKQPLVEALSENPEWLGTHAASVANGEFPILIKLVDAKEKLSVQVHPDDEFARSENDLGKTEMWYVLDAKPGAQLVYGFRQDMDADLVREAAENGTIERYLNRVSVEKNDVFFLEPGIIHAIGEGILLAEIQESSDLTYRLYDYDRVDSDGKKRELHIEKAMKVIDLKSSAEPRQPMRLLKYLPGYASEMLCRCRYFQVERVLLNTGNKETVSYKTGSNSFHVLLCIEGSAKLSSGDFSLGFIKGNCVFVPAESVSMVLEGNAQFLDVSC